MDSRHYDLPLRECLVAANVPAFAGLAAFTTLGVTAPRGTGTTIGHCD